jgi:hypothetical protein
MKKWLNIENVHTLRMCAPAILSHPPICRFPHPALSSTRRQESQGRAEKPALKRGRDDEDSPPRDGGDEDGMRKRNFKSSLEPQKYDDDRKFACPFFKYDPNIYSRFGSCTGPGFASVSRVKFFPTVIIPRETL